MSLLIGYETPGNRDRDWEDASTACFQDRGRLRWRSLGDDWRDDQQHQKV